MKKIMLLLTLFIIASCEIQYDGETKLVVKGKVIGDTNLPLTNKEIKLFVTTDNAGSFLYQIPSETNFIGTATTDSNGNYIMIIPQPKNFSQIIVETNGENNMLNEQQFINIKLENFINYELNLPVAKLFNRNDLCFLIVFPNQTNPNHELLDIDFIGEIPIKIVAISPFDDEFPFENSLDVKKNQTLIIQYTVRDTTTNITTMSQQNVVIDNSPEINFILNY